MSDDLFTLVDKPQPGSNLPEFSVSDIATGIKKTLEETYGRIRVRGEISQPKIHTSGHLYLDLKDENAVMAAVAWKGTVNKLSFRPEHGMDVIATGRITTYGKTSKYQLVIEEMALAGQGALLAMLEARKAKLQAEGLFDRKRKLPFLPRRIGIITSETGAVIQDILHRLQDRFPVEVLLWPVAVQGPNAATQIAAAITGMNEGAANGTLPAPDLIIVARGGGSLEDLMAFNEEIVVRAAATSRLPLISAVGHETDTTLIDFAADLRAPTPTAAAELAVPVRRDLLAQINDSARRLQQLLQNQSERARLQLHSASRALGDPERLLESAQQRLDDQSDKLTNRMQQLMERRKQQLTIKLPPLTALVASAERHLLTISAQLAPRLQALVERRQDRLERASALLESHSYQKVLQRGFALIRKGGEPVTQAASLKDGDRVEIIFGDGQHSADITRTP